MRRAEFRNWITVPGLINVDFADVRTIMREMGDALMGTGVATGEHRATEAANNAISSPLLDGVSIAGAQGVLVNVMGGLNMSLAELDEATMISMTRRVTMPMSFSALLSMKISRTN